MFLTNYHVGMDKRCKILQENNKKGSSICLGITSVKILIFFSKDEYFWFLKVHVITVLAMNIKNYL